VRGEVSRVKPRPSGGSGVAPTIVDRAEWKAHAEYWRHSLDTGHGSPDGPGTPPRYRNGTPFSPVESFLEQEWDLLKAWVQKHVPWLSKLVM
jgi:hypothetical protein